jgi:hypothetical protein
VRRLGAKILKVDAEMARHDAAMNRFSQWWSRSRRMGHAYAKVAALQGGGEERYFVRDRAKIWFWGLVLPALALGLAPFTHGLSLAAMLFGVCTAVCPHLRPWPQAQLAGRRRRGLRFLHCAFEVPRVAGIAGLPLAPGSRPCLDDHRIQEEFLRRMNEAARIQGTREARKLRSSSAQEYLDELDRCGGIRIERPATAILRFYLTDLVKWAVKVAVRHPERRLPSYRDWESRTQRATFDCTAARTELDWQPVSEREELVRRGIEEPLMELMR